MTNPITLYEGYRAEITVTAIYPEWQSQTITWDDEDIWYTLLDGECYRTVRLRSRYNLSYQYSNRLEILEENRLFYEFQKLDSGSNGIDITVEWRKNLIAYLVEEVL